MKKVIRLSETQLIQLIKESIENDDLKTQEYFFRRRGVDLEKLDEMINFQESVQDLENFDGGTEFAEFCIDTAVRFYFGDEGYNDDDDWDDDDWDYGMEDDEIEDERKEPETNKDSLPPESAYEVRKELEEYLYKKYFNDIKTNFDDFMSDES